MLMTWPQLRWVGQEHTYGCQVATTAMVLGLSYREALALYPREPVDSGFIELYQDNILANHGIAVARKWNHDASAGADRTPWPPAPFGEVHTCLIYTALGGHSVILLGDGTVLDPASLVPTRLEELGKVMWVAALARVEVSRR